MKLTRRLLSGTGAAAGFSLLAGVARAAAAETVRDVSPPALDPIPVVPATPAPGKPGDFGFSLRRMAHQALAAEARRPRVMDVWH